jgi:hypothetical protein
MSDPIAPKEPPAICPHGFLLVDNVCGPCSKGEPNRPASVKEEIEYSRHGN